jgi:hypothetical protein
MAMLMKYPPQFRIGFLSKNSARYNLVPNAKKMFEQNGFGTPND